VYARRTICTFLEHSVFQKLHDNLPPGLEHKFVLVPVPLPLPVHLEGFLNVVVDPPNVQDDIVLGSFGSIFVLNLIQLQLIYFLCRDQQPTFEKTELGCKLGDLENQRSPHAKFEF